MAASIHELQIYMNSVLVITFITFIILRCIHTLWCKQFQSNWLQSNNNTILTYHSWLQCQLMNAGLQICNAYPHLGQFMFEGAGVIFSRSSAWFCLTRFFSWAICCSALYNGVVKQEQINPYDLNNTVFMTNCCFYPRKGRCVAWWGFHFFQVASQHSQERILYVKRNWLIHPVKKTTQTNKSCLLIIHPATHWKKVIKRFRCYEAKIEKAAVTEN